MTETVPTLYERHEALTPAAAFAVEALVAQHFARYAELDRERYAEILSEAEAVTS